MTRRRDRVSLGDVMSRRNAKESSLAAEVYNPGFDASSDGDPRNNADQRDPSESLDPGKHDVSGTAAKSLQDYAERNAENVNIYASRTDRTFLETSANPIRRANFLSKTQSSARLGNFVRDYRATSDYQQFPMDSKLVTKQVRSTNAGGTGVKSTAYTGPAPEGTINFEVHADLQEKNLHAPDRAFLNPPGEGREDETLRDGMYSLQGGSLGKFDKNRRRMQVDDLKKAALATLENARGMKNFKFEDPDIEDIVNLLLSEAAPTVAVLQDVYDLRISKVDNIVEKFNSQAESGQDDIARIYDLESNTWKGFSYGHLNTPSQPFTGFPIGTVITAFIGMIIARTMVTFYAPFMKWFIFSETDEMKKGVGNLEKLARNSIRGIRNELGLVEPENIVDTIDVDECLIDGFYEFYGYNTQLEDYNETKSEVGYFEKINPFNYVVIWDTPAYYANIARLLMRDATLILSAVKSIKDYKNVSSVLNDALTSFGFRLMATFFKLGMGLKTRSGEDQKFIGDKNKPYVMPNLILNGSDSEISTAKNFIKNRNAIMRFVHDESHSKNHEFRYSALSARLFPGHILADADLPFDPNNLQKIEYQKIRLSPEEVEQIEDIIDTDYVPFSIQDVRTNEVISLPAFIETIGDSFNVTYESTHGYGRTDPVHSYSKTERTINMTFALVAMGKADHQFVWNIVNRLVSMCYPQRSAGTRQTDGQWEFTQPFTQIPTASPLVRIRLGDIMRSNRTVNSFRWLFGELKRVEPKPAVAPPTHQRRTPDDVLEKDSQIRLPFNAVHELLNEGYAIGDGTLNKGHSHVEFDSSPPGIYRVVNRANKNPDNTEPLMQKLREWKPYADLRLKGDSVLRHRNSPESQRIHYSKVSHFSHFYERVSNNEIIYFLEFGDGKYVASHSDLINKVIVPAPPPVPQPPPSPPVTQLSEDDFYKPENNAVVRSFHSTSGRGLAGFIKDLQLDYSGFTWRTDSGTNAPMGIKIAMSFAPIHDMPLGLDHNGRMISPSHPVGVPYPKLNPGSNN